ncbi:hypothetical protein [Pseudoalteromonas rhizosphaerae]|uniref:Uncharacterized protein n=1 Tax=Pseudoalteromonas rhizosphaerae TaxID=2518973 RepID=A0ABW8KZF9_9GAMM
MGGLGSLTGGGGLSSSSSAASGTGDQAANIGFQGGAVNFGSNNNNQILIIGAIALAALFLLKK